MTIDVACKMYFSTAIILRRSFSIIIQSPQGTAPLLTRDLLENTQEYNLFVLEKVRLYK